MGLLFVMRRRINVRRFGSRLPLADYVLSLFLSLSKERNDRWNIIKAAGEGGDKSAAGSDPILKRFWPNSVTKAIARARFGITSVSSRNSAGSSLPASFTLETSATAR